MNTSSTDILPALGIDYGTARIGIASTDPMGILCFPVETIELKHTDPFTRIAELCRTRSIQTLVLGLPLRLDGSEGDAAQAVHSFAESLRKACPALPLLLVDERLTTVAAHEKMHEAGRKAKHRKHTIDQAAAVEILQTWLDEQGLNSHL